MIYNNRIFVKNYKNPYPIWTYCSSFWNFQFNCANQF